MVLILDVFFFFCFFFSLFGGGASSSESIDLRNVRVCKDLSDHVIDCDDDIKGCVGFQGREI